MPKSERTKAQERAKIAAGECAWLTCTDRRGKGNYCEYHHERCKLIAREFRRKRKKMLKGEPMNTCHNCSKVLPTVLDECKGWMYQTTLKHMHRGKDVMVTKMNEAWVCPDCQKPATLTTVQQLSNDILKAFPNADIDGFVMASLDVAIRCIKTKAMIQTGKMIDNAFAIESLIELLEKIRGAEAKANLTIVKE